jgi:predicted HTH domain antitoxin
MNTTEHIEIPRDVLESARLTSAELKLELALSLYAQRRLSIGKARELAGMSLWAFRQQLAARQIPVHLDSDDIEDEIATLQRLGRL